MFLMPFRNFGFSLILLVVTFPACRADDDIQLVLGSTMQQVLDQQPQVRSLLQKAPAIQNVLDTTADTANKIIKENEFLASIDRCGFDKPPTREQFAETIVRDPINIYTESIQSDKNPLIAVNIQTRIFSIDHFKQYLETQDVKTSLLNKSSFKNKNLKLAATLITEATLPNSTAVVLGPIQPIAVETKLPIIIRSNCFQLNQGEEISTDGRDLYIVSDKVVINGTIRTTPQGRDDQPGDAAGSVYIIAVNLEFGIDSKVDVTGGNGGNINLSAGKFIGDAFTPDKQAFFSEVERSLNLSSETHFTSRAVVENDAELIFKTWESIRLYNIVADPVTIENDIYNPDKISKSNSKDPLVITYANLRDNLATNEKTKTERVRFINEFRWAIVDAWMRAIKDANLNSESHEEKEKSYWISPKKLSVQIQDAITAKKTDSPDNKGTFVLKNVQYSQLPGGLYGQLHTGSLHPKGLPQFLSGIGNPSPESKIEPQWIVGGDTIHLPVKTSIVPIVHFTMKKDKDDITSTSPSLAGEDVFSKTEFIDVKLVKSTSKDILSMPHPNAKNAVTSGNKKAFIPINDNDLDSIFKNLGIAEENSKMREAIQVHKETKENIK